MEAFSIDFILVEILVIVSVVSIIVRRIKMPYTLGLVLTGLIISIFKIPIGIELEPELILTLFLPALLFEGAMNIDVGVLRKSIKSISLLALAGTFFSTVIIAWLLSFFIKIPFEISLLFASMIAPTDPIAVLGIFKELGVGKKISVLIEGESLFNDGVAIVFFRIILALIASGTFSILSGLSSFMKLFLGGLVLGFIIGYLASRLVRKIDDSLIQMTVTTILAYGSYLLAERLAVSGVVATVTAGLVMGGYGLNFLSSTTRLNIATFWEYLGFLLNSVVFLLIGAKLDINEFWAYKWFILIAFVLVMLARAVSIYAISYFINNIDDSGLITNVNENIEPNGQHVLVWGGIHGALSMVLLLGINVTNIPTLAPYFGLLHALIFGVVFLSLVLQGSTMAFVIKRLGLSRQLDINLEYQQLISRLIMKTAAEEELNQLYKSKFITKSVYQENKKRYAAEKEDYERRVAQLLKKEKGIKEAQDFEVRKAVLIAKKDALQESFRRGIITEDTFHDIRREIDDELVKLQLHKIV